MRLPGEASKVRDHAPASSIPSMAIAFAVVFYNALGAGEIVEFAFNLGRIELIRLKEDQILVLKTAPIYPADIQSSHQIHRFSGLIKIAFG